MPHPIYLHNSDHFESSVNEEYCTTQETPLVMGILNITPDSFSDGDEYNSVELAYQRAQLMRAAGADILDVGGESTRPGASAVSVADEIARVVPVIERIKSLDLPISVDTSKPAVMQAAVKAGASMINDVRALQEDGALAMAADLNVPICLMHMQGQPRSMQNSPSYKNVVAEVAAFLQQRIMDCENAGIDRELLSIDPGFGFGKSLAHNLQLLDKLDELHALKLPLLAGLSRKSMLGTITGKSVDARLSGSLAVALIAMQKGAKIIRVHDVDETVDIRKVFMALKTARL